MYKATIRQFKALPIERPKNKKASEKLLNETLNRGFIFAPEVIANYSENELLDITKDIGLTPDQLNKAFHKSWNKIKTADIRQLIVEQMIHYITTYGFEKLGIYDENSVYIPNEELNIPELEENLNLIVIKGLTKIELKKKLLKLLGSGIALKEETIKDITDVALFVELNEKEVEAIKNKEVKVIMYEYLNITPQNAVEFLRYIVYKSTEESLLIKSGKLIADIAGKENIRVTKLFHDYEKKYGLIPLAEIFNRFKPIFFAFRTNKSLKVIINKIGRMAKVYHKPMSEDFLNEVTAKLKRGEDINQLLLISELQRVNIFRKIRLAYALKYRTKDIDSILYRVRNGKSFAKEFEFKNKKRAKEILDIVLVSIAVDMQKQVKGKKIYIPDTINYALPATEKQFSGNFPSGSYVIVDKDMLFGIYWENQKGHRVDLDLALISIEGKTGWDAQYRNDNASVLFSGDVTDAPRGATELFYIKKQKKSNHIMSVNYFNHDDDGKPAPYKIIIAKKQMKTLKENYMVDPNDVVMTVDSEMVSKQKILGLVVTRADENRFYFAETYLGNAISSSNDEKTTQTREYLFGLYEDSIDLKSLLIDAWAEIVDNKEDADIDLSPEALEKDTILNLLIEQK